MRTAILVMAAMLLAAGVYVAVRHFAQPSTPSTPNASLPGLVLTDIKGKTILTSDYKGKVVVVNFWAVWCTPCTEEIPHFVALQQKHGPEGVQVVGISIDDIDRELRSFYDQHQMNYPVIAGDQKLTDAFGGVPGLPTTFILDRNLRVRSRQVGPTNFHTLEEQVLALLHD